MSMQPGQSLRINEKGVGRWKREVASIQVHHTCRCILNIDLFIDELVRHKSIILYTVKFSCACKLAFALFHLITRPIEGFECSL